MNECLNDNKAIPQWYVMRENKQIVGGLGVIANDFHVRKDLAPNVCAVYVEYGQRNLGIAGNLLDYVCKDMKRKGIKTLYLLTDHTSIYERYGWSFYELAQCEDENRMSRMYVKHL